MCLVPTRLISRFRIPGLTCAMYMDEEGREVGNPDPSSGLYIEDRLGRVVKVSRGAGWAHVRGGCEWSVPSPGLQAVFPPSSLAFQIGRSMQIHSGGLLRATRHCVKVRTPTHPPIHMEGSSKGVRYKPQNWFSI